MLIRTKFLSNHLPLRHKIANASRYAIRSLKILLVVSLQLKYTTACQYHFFFSLSRRGQRKFALQRTESERASSVARVKINEGNHHIGYVKNQTSGLV